MKLVDLALYLVYISTYFIIIPVLAGIYYFKSLTPALKFLFLRLCLIFALDISLLFFDLKSVSTFFYFYTLIDVVMITWMYTADIKRNLFSKTTTVLCLVFILFIILDAFYISGFAEKGISNAIVKSYLLFLALYYLTDLFHYRSEINLATYPIFWVTIGIVAFNLFGSFDILSDAVLSFSQNMYLQYYSIWSIAAIFAYIVYAYAFKLSHKFNVN